MRVVRRNHHVATVAFATAVAITLAITTDAFSPLPTSSHGRIAPPSSFQLYSKKAISWSSLGRGGGVNNSRPTISQPIQLPPGRRQQQQQQRPHPLNNWNQRSFPSSTTSLNSDIQYSTPDPEFQQTPPPIEPKVYDQRWIQLLYLSLLALLSDWICFSVAASPSTFEQAFPGHSAASLIDMFLFTNVASCFLVTDILNRFGLEKSIKGAALLMSVGCLLRSGFGFLVPMAHALGLNEAAAAVETFTTTTITVDSAQAGLVPYPLIVAGTILVGAAQPFFQCTPPLLSATWFAPDERATSTAVALNFNQIGIATAFLVGGGMTATGGEEGLAKYFVLITGICAVVTVGTILQFQDRPPTPPSSSEIEKLIRGEKEPPFIDSVKKFFSTPGFTRPLAAFVCSISITNIVGAFIDEVLERGGITNQFSIDLAGAGFELAILLGGIFIGGYVDRTKQYKNVTLYCLLATMFLVVPLGLTEHAIGKEPFLVIAALLGLGLSAGPIQPINAELAVDVSYPGDETAVESVQQIGGNLISALLVPVAEMAAEQDYQLLPRIPTLASDIRGDVILLLGIAVVTYGFFSGFDAPLKRTMADNEGEDDGHGEEIMTLEMNANADEERLNHPVEKELNGGGDGGVVDARIVEKKMVPVEKVVQ